MVAHVTDRRCGALVTFDGLVRDHDEGRGVERLSYTAHPSAGDVMADVVRTIAERYPDVFVAASHRYGDLAVGDSALVAAVAAPHRKRAFEACGDLVDEVKARVPIWKDQYFSDGSHEWVGAIG
ncbi:molybdenum cofactor biosynthesis protein MoaE [Dermabacter sp. p3-SID358]|nr:molybdenum cofactor biosynthesis protein MoaE [Dermabacter sp. p3-SID358]